MLTNLWEAIHVSSRMTCKNGMQKDAFWVNVNLVWGEHFPIMPNGEQWVWSIVSL